MAPISRECNFLVLFDAFAFPCSDGNRYHLSASAVSFGTPRPSSAEDFNGDGIVNLAFTGVGVLWKRRRNISPAAPVKVALYGDGNSRAIQSFCGGHVNYDEQPLG
jgi:hypothetical protein